MQRKYFWFTEDKVSQTKGGLIAFNSFLSTSMEEKISMKFAQRCLKDPALVGVLFIMNFDPQQSTIPFASVTDVGHYKDKENEILFAMHTVFRIQDIKQIEGENKRLFRVELELTSDNDEDLQVLTKRIREETDSNERGWDRLGVVLQKLGKPKQAEDIYQILLQQETDESKNGWLYCRLGMCKQGQVEYEEAIRFYEKSIEIYKKYSPNDPNLAVPYSNIGNVYYCMNLYTKALSYYEKALRITQQSLPSNHPNLASVYGSIGNVYWVMGDNVKALSYYEKALRITQRSLPSNHPDLASVYSSIGNVYWTSIEYGKALSYYEKAVKIAEKSLPSNHPNLKVFRNNFDKVKNKL